MTRPFVRAILGIAVLVFSFRPYPAQAADPLFEPLKPRLTDALSAAGLAPDRAAVLVQSLETVNPDPSFMGRKLRALHRAKFPPPQTARNATGNRTSGLPAEPRVRKTLYDVHLTPVRLAEIRLWRFERESAFTEAHKKYGVPPEVILAFLVIETRLGEFLGKQPLLDVLANLAAATDPTAYASFTEEYAPTDEARAWLAGRMADKATQAFKELVLFFVYCERNGIAPATVPGSIYGAFGLAQFTPESAVKLAMDGDGDGRADLFNPPDAIASIARYLKTAGYAEQASREKKLKAFRAYNNDEVYAKTVLEVADLLRGP